MPLNNPKILINFLTTYQPDGDENEAIFSRFKNTISDKDSLRITFSQQKAYDNRSLMYLNIYHPIIQASLNYFIKNDDRTKTSFCYAIKDEKGIYETNLYYMAIYQLSMHRIVQGVEKRSETLLPLLYNVRNKSIVTDKDIVNSIFSKSQVSGIEHNASNNNIDRDMIQDMRYDFAEYISNEVKNKVGELNNQAESERFRNEQQTIEYYKSRIENYERNIDEWEQILDYTYYENTKERRRWEGAIRLAKANISQLEHEMEEHLNQINNDPKIGIESEIISINLINIL
jgi:hypothetical protein